MADRLNEMRPCGDCMLCCKVMAVKELEKPCDKWCTHAARGLDHYRRDSEGLVQIGGCKIYSERPSSCSGFDCAWRLGILPEQYKPNKIHAVVWVSDEKRPVVTVHIDKSYPGARESEPVRKIIEAMSGGFQTVVIEGSKRSVYVESLEDLPEGMREKIEAKMREGHSWHS